MLNNFSLHKKNIVFFLIIAIIILWQMLLPGYVLTLDMVFTPKLHILHHLGDFYNSLPLTALLEFLNFFLSGWIIEKIILVSLFFLIGYLAFVFLPVPKKYHAHYFAALLYTINPFVYERFLAGQWTLLFAYALLPPFFYYLIALKDKPV